MRNVVIDKKKLEKRISIEWNDKCDGISGGKGLKSEKSCRCDYVDWAAERHLLTGAIPLLLNTSAFGC